MHFKLLQAEFLSKSLLCGPWTSKWMILLDYFACTYLFYSYYSYCKYLDSQYVTPYQVNIMEGTCQLLPLATEESLMLLLDTLGSSVKVKIAKKLYIYITDERVTDIIYGVFFVLYSRLIMKWRLDTNKHWHLLYWTFGKNSLQIPSSQAMFWMSLKNLPKIPSTILLSALGHFHLLVKSSILPMVNQLFLQ